MNRRIFNKKMLAAGAGIVVLPFWSTAINSPDLFIRLGGPIHTGYTNPDEWITALKKLGIVKKV